MAAIKVDDIIDDVHERCSDMAHTKEESLQAYEEIQEACETAADDLRSEIDDDD